MASLNKVQLIGNLGADPEYKVSQGGLAISKLRIATTDRYKDKNGDMKEETEWHTVTFFGNLADICQKYLAKGKSVYVEGRIKTSTYDKEGEKRYFTEIMGQSLQMLGSREQGERQAPSQSENDAYMPKDTDTSTVNDTDDIPF